MKAVVCQALSEDLSGVAIQDLPAPSPGAGEVLVRLKAAALNFPDWLMTSGRYQYRPEPPFIMGTEAAGNVEALGEGVSGFEIGQPVIIGGRHGCFAEQAAVPAAQVRPLPNGLSHAEGAALTVTGLTAYVGLAVRGKVSAGETALITGAGGGVGLASIQMARSLGARVIAAASSAVKLQAAKAAGADDLLELPRGGLTPAELKQALKTATGLQEVDVVLDCIGGPWADPLVRLLAWKGRYLVAGFAAGGIPKLPLNLVLLKGASVIGVRAGEHGRRDPAAADVAIKSVDRLAGEGVLKPPIGARFPLVNAKDALLHMGAGEAIGKVVLEM